VSIGTSASDSPDWATRAFKASPDAVYEAAQRAIMVHHQLKEAEKDSHTLRFHVGTTAWSWGYNMVMRIKSQPDGSSRASVDIDRSGGKAVSWGSGKKEVIKLFDATEQNLKQ
jgi:hypothetical protein